MGNKVQIAGQTIGALSGASAGLVAGTALAPIPIVGPIIGGAVALLGGLIKKPILERAKSPEEVLASWSHPIPDNYVPFFNPSKNKWDFTYYAGSTKGVAPRTEPTGKEPCDPNDPNCTQVKSQYLSFGLIDPPAVPQVAAAGPDPSLATTSVTQAASSAVSSIASTQIEIAGKKISLPLLLIAGLVLLLILRR